MRSVAARGGGGKQRRGGAGEETRSGDGQMGGGAVVEEFVGGWAGQKKISGLCTRKYSTL